MCYIIFTITCNEIVMYLFRDSSEGDASESDESSIGEQSLETEASVDESASCVSTVIGGEERAIFINQQGNSSNNVYWCCNQSILTQILFCV